MPASRNDAATTFAPRSWPSRPGLATSTRMGRIAKQTSGRADGWATRDGALRRGLAGSGGWFHELAVLHQLARGPEHADAALDGDEVDPGIRDHELGNRRLPCQHMKDVGVFGNV